MSSFLNKHQRLASWGVLGVLLFILAVLVWGPIQGQYDRYRFELSRDARTIQRLQALLASRDELQVASALFEEQGLGDWVFPPDMSDTAIELAIQKNVSDSLSKAGAEVQSIAPVNSRNNEGYKAIGVRVQFSGGLDAIMSGLQALEQSRPLLVLDDLLLSPGPVLARGQTTVPPQIVEAQLSVLTFLPLSVRGGRTMTPIVLSKSRVTILLLAMITLMLLLTVVVWFSVSEEALRVPAPHRYSMPELSEPGPLDSNLESVSERPLLWPSRRPASRSEQTAEMAADVSPEGISALGIILQGDTRTALLSLPAGVQRVYVGSEIPGGWKVMAIEPGRVRLESDDNSFDLEVARPRNEAIRLEPVAEPE